MQQVFQTMKLILVKQATTVFQILIIQIKVEPHLKRCVLRELIWQVQELTISTIVRSVQRDYIVIRQIQQLQSFAKTVMNANSDQNSWWLVQEVTIAISVLTFKELTAQSITIVQQVLEPLSFVDQVLSALVKTTSLEQNALMVKLKLMIQETQIILLKKFVGHVLKVRTLMTPLLVVYRVLQVTYAMDPYLTMKLILIKYMIISDFDMVQTLRHL